MDFRRIFDLFPYQAAHHANKSALVWRKNMHWQQYSTDQCTEHINSVSAALLNLGLDPGDAIVIITDYGDPYYHFLEMGALQIGLTLIPLSSDFSREDLVFIFQQNQVKFCFCRDRESYQLVSTIKLDLKQLKKVFTLHTLPDVDSLEDLMSNPMAHHLQEVQTLKASIHEDDLALLFFNKNEGGELLGLMFSHKNIISTVKGLLQFLEIRPAKTALSFRKTSLLSESILLYTYFAAGAKVYFHEGQKNLLEIIRTIKPNFFGADPETPDFLLDQLFEKGSQQKSWYRNLIAWSIKTGKQFSGRSNIKPTYWFKLLVADLLVYRSWRRKLGGKLEGIIIGSHLIPQEMSRLFSAANLPVFNGFGVLEASVYTTLRPPNPQSYDFMRIGNCLSSCEIRLDPDRTSPSGEIQIKGDNVMLGYFQEEEKTKAAFTEDGWLKTNAMGAFHNNQYLYYIK